MRVKVGDLIFDSRRQPIMLILSPKDKADIGMMAVCDTKYMACMSGAFEDQDAAEAWMQLGPRDTANGRIRLPENP